MERRRAEKAELFQKGGGRAVAGKENVDWRIGFIFEAEAFFFFLYNDRQRFLKVIFWLLRSFFANICNIIASPFVHRGLFQLQVGLHTRHGSHVGG